MRIDIIVTKSKTTPQTWEVVLLSGGVSLAPAYTMCCVESNGQSFPAPAASPDHTIPTSELSKKWTSLLNRDEDHIVCIFGAHLFQSLLGEGAWQAIQTKSQGHPEIELALLFDDDDHTLNRMTWELMYDPASKEFLSSKIDPNKINITRRVKSLSVPIVPDVSSRLLIVVGGDMNAEDIRPGAEYLGLMRSFQSKGYIPHHHLLIEATERKLKAAVQAFKPTIVHFIAHGVEMPDEHAAGIKLVSDDDPSQTSIWSAEKLLEFLRFTDNTDGTGAAHLPRAVVLNACSTATTNEIKNGRPMAMQLVRGGIRLVIGMAGRVDDQACRLFVRGLYEALTDDKNVVQAVADGRRAAVRYLRYDSANVLDWGLPVLVLPDVAPETKLKSQEMTKQLGEAIDITNFAPAKFPVFCGRMDAMSFYDVLMSDLKVQPELVADAKKLQFLGMVAESTQPGANANRQMGCSRTLREMARRAFIDGHMVFCIDGKTPFNTKNKDMTYRFLATLRDSMDSTVFVLREKVTCHSGLSWSSKHINKLLALMNSVDNPAKQPVAPATPEFSAEFCESYNNVEGTTPNGDLLAWAFRLDVMDLLNQIKTQRKSVGETGEVRCLVVLDHVHLWCGATEFVFKHLMGGRGMASSDANLFRAIYAWSSASTDESATNALKDFHEKQSSVRTFKLQELHRNKDVVTSAELQLYKHLLLGWRDSEHATETLALQFSAEADREGITNKLLHYYAGLTEGAPSGFHDSRLHSSIKEKVETNMFIEKCPDQFLIEALKMGKRFDGHGFY